MQFAHSISDSRGIVLYQIISMQIFRDLYLILGAWGVLYYIKLVNSNHFRNCQCNQLIIFILMKYRDKDLIVGNGLWSKGCFKIQSKNVAKTAEYKIQQIQVFFWRVWVALFVGLWVELWHVCTKFDWNKDQLRESVTHEDSPSQVPVWPWTN